MEIFSRLVPQLSKTDFYSHEPDIEQVLREKKSFTLRCMLDVSKKLQGRVVTWNKCASSVSIT
jgi:hypothetical protein